jgi:hypothetical protein
MKSVDEWFYDLCALKVGESFGAEGFWNRVKTGIKSKLIESYNAGKAAPKS